MTNQTMTRIQYQRAAALAAAHSHAWAFALLPPQPVDEFDRPALRHMEDLSPIQRAIEIAAQADCVPVALVDRATDEVSDDRLPGGQSVFVDAVGRVAHTTGSGRLTWRVYSDGRVEIEVARPNAVARTWRSGEGRETLIERYAPDGCSLAEHGARSAALIALAALPHEKRSLQMAGIAWLDGHADEQDTALVDRHRPQRPWASDLSPEERAVKALDAWEASTRRSDEDDAREAIEALPPEVVLRAVVSPEGRVEISDPDPVTCADRHVCALEDALRALLDAKLFERAMAPIRAIIPREMIAGEAAA